MKGLTPIIATVLVISFTIAVGAVVALWGTGFIVGSTQTIEKQSDGFVSCSNTVLQIQKVSCNEDSSLLGLWHLDDGSGSTARDSSPNGRQINLTSPTWTGGKYGGALSFGGSGSGAVQGSETLNPGKFTIEAWVYRP